MLLAWILGFSLIGSVGALSAAALLLVVPAPRRRGVLPVFLSYATGVLLATAFLDILPEALEALGAEHVFATVLGAVVVFFALEKLIRWHHHDGHEHKAAGPLVLIGDAVHILVDGVVIAAAFLTSVPLGVAAGIAVAAHEIAHKLGDFAILLDAGYRPARAYWLSLATSLPGPVGAVVAYFSLGPLAGAGPYLLAVAAGSFIYIANADLVPELHAQQGQMPFLLQMVCIVVGIGTVVLMHVLLPAH